MTNAPELPQATFKDHRLHPSSPLFLFLSAVRSAVIPLVVFVFAEDGSPLRILLLLVLIPTALMPLLRYLTFRFRFEEDHFVVRSGVLSRQLRRVPYVRIQNVDRVQNPLHRALGVATVTVETASGARPEAVLQVVSLDVADELRGLVRSARYGPDVAEGESAADLDGGALSEEERSAVLLELPLRELVIHGLVTLQGLVVVGAVMAFLAQQGAVERVLESRYVQGAVAVLLEPVLSSGLLFQTVGAVLVAVFGMVSVLVLSVALSVVRYYGFRLVRDEEQLRSTFGLFTRLSVTTPRFRIQRLRVLQGVLARRFGRVGVKIDKAGGAASGPEAGGARSHPWLAPLCVEGEVGRLVSEAMPELPDERPAWQFLPARAIRRRLVPRLPLLLPLVVAAVLLQSVVLGGLTLLVGAGLVFSVVRWVRNFRYGVDDEAIYLRSGWLGRTWTIVRFAKVQAVQLVESPFDRRHDMATLRLDTTNSGGAHGVVVPYLTRDQARALRASVTANVLREQFEWG